MRPLSRFLVAGLGLGLLLVLGVVSAQAAATLTQHIDPPEANVGDEVTVTFSVQNGSGANIRLPNVDGLQLAGTSTQTNFTIINGSMSSAVSQVFTIVPTRTGTFTIPAFDVPLQDGGVLHSQPMTLKVVAGGAPSSPNGSAPSGLGPVMMPPAMANPSNGNAADLSNPNITPPVESDGRPARVFMLITPKTTDAYVGETVPLRIEFFIRMDVIAQQDSLPTMKGSDFLMNDLSVRPGEDDLTLMNEPYHRETWITALSAPRNGDFPLQMVRDTYWTKGSNGVFTDPLGNFFGPRPQLAHGNIPSNQLTMHVHALPDEGRPADFTGAIGQFKASGNATPTAVNVGDPVYLDFSVSGEGNFDHVRSPALTPDPAWKSYVASSKVEYADESRTQGNKTFHQAIIPQKNGNLPLPNASFSYFDSTQKKYVTIPIPLPLVTVSGTSVPTAATAPAGADNSTPATASSTTDLNPNRLELGSLQADFVPAYRQPWFWLVQGGALLLLVIGALGVWISSRRGQDRTGTERALRQRTLRELEEAMSDAVNRQDAPAFFFAARQAVQLQWGARWNLPPEAVTLPLIAARDPQAAETLGPLFAQADEVIYSGLNAGNLNLAEWELHVREELLQLQAA